MYVFFIIVGFIFFFVVVGFIGMLLVLSKEDKEYVFFCLMGLVGLRILFIIDYLFIEMIFILMLLFISFFVLGSRIWI